MKTAFAKLAATYALCVAAASCGGGGGGEAQAVSSGLASGQRDPTYGSNGTVAISSSNGLGRMAVTLDGVAYLTGAVIPQARRHGNATRGFRRRHRPNTLARRFPHRR